MKRIAVKVKGMRKADDCVVYPDRGDGTIQIQGHRLIARFDAETGEGVINYKGSNSKYGVHLSPALGAEPITFDAEFIAKCKEIQPRKGDTIANGVGIIG
jgi:hypothetical protein